MGADGAPLPQRQSQGADLARLLAEAEPFYAQAHFRYRSFVEAVDTRPPPVDVAAFEEVCLCRGALRWLRGSGSGQTAGRPHRAWAAMCCVVGHLRAQAGPQRAGRCRTTMPAAGAGH
jgi:hypothetical protein